VGRLSIPSLSEAFVQRVTEVSRAELGSWVCAWSTGSQRSVADIRWNAPSWLFSEAVPVTLSARLQLFLRGLC
jgi:hypothetical protein